MEHNANICMDALMDQDIKDTIAGAVLYSTLIVAMPVALVAAIAWSGYEWMKTRS